MSATVEE